MVRNAWQKALDEWISTGDDRPAKALRKYKVALDAESYERLAAIALGEIKPAKRPKGSLKDPNLDNNNGAILGVVMGFLKNHDDLLEVRRKAKSEPWADWETVAKGLESRAAAGVTEAMHKTVDWFASRIFHVGKPVTLAKVRSVVYGVPQGLNIKQGKGLAEKNRKLLIEWWDQENAKEKAQHEAWRARQLEIARQEEAAILALLRFYCG